MGFFSSGGAQHLAHAVFSVHLPDYFPSAFSCPGTEFCMCSQAFVP